MNFSLKDASWEDDREALRLIRRIVFIEEQHVPEEMEWDEFDTSSYHVLAIDNHGHAIGCSRLKTDGQIGRMAVLNQWRNRGVGTALLQRILKLSCKLGMQQVYLHAQVTAIPFYERHGFKVTSDIFMDAGIPHRNMILSLESS